MGDGASEVSCRCACRRSASPAARAAWVRGAVALAVWVAAACAPSLPPFVSAETADVLARKQVAISVAGGGAGLTTDARTVGLCCGGGEARVRVGVGRDQEVSADAAVVTTGEVWAISSRLGWKRATASWFAVTAGATGVLHTYSLGKFVGLGADIGVIASRPPSPHRRAQLYGGLRAGAEVPALSDPFAGSGVIGSLAIPIGVAVRSSAATRLYIEGGAIVTRTWYRAGDAVDSYPLNGAYGALAFAVVF